MEWCSAVSKLPRKPGVYLFKDDEGRVIYVGKGKDLVHLSFVP